ncbi:hypothetical protein [Actinoplanes sp. NPDC051494]|uniref:hypothetical protein n=1 Tax=Actinoplanes sp. NPDC051494 TaxID=3363907 RepID=UPI0037A66451
MPSPWPASTLADLARTRLRIENGQVVAIEADDDHLPVIFNWRQNPTRFAVRSPWPDDTPEGPWTGLPMDSAEEWVAEWGGFLSEELSNGLVRWGLRTPRDGYVELNHPPPAEPSGFSVTDLPPGLGAGIRLTLQGLDIAAGRRASWNGHLLAWLRAVEHTTDARTLGHAVVTREPDHPHTARLTALGTVPGAPAELAAHLVVRAQLEAADAGATHLVTALPGPIPHFPTTPGDRTLPTDHLPTDPSPAPDPSPAAYPGPPPR